MKYPKNKKKKGHITNPRPPEGTICDICQNKQATETHELSGGSNRNNSIKYGFQMFLCNECHRNWHELYTKEKKNAIRAEYQRHVMGKHGMDLMAWRIVFGKSFL